MKLLLISLHNVAPEYTDVSKIRIGSQYIQFLLLL